MSVVLRFPGAAGTNDAEARAAIRDALDETLVVEAAAGTGKTTELVNRILRVVETGRAGMDQVVAVTFTEKAAGELKLRIRETLETRRGEAKEADVRARLDEALTKLEEAHVNTIHGFCAELIRERPVEACVDPLFAVLTEPQAEHLYARAFQAWLQQALANPSEGLRRALRRTSSPAFGGAGNGDGPVDRLRRAGRSLVEWRDFPEPWHRPPFDRGAAIVRVLGHLHRLAQLTDEPVSERDNLYVDTDAVRRLSRQIMLEESFDQIDHDGWESRLVDLVRDRGLSRTRKGSGYKFGRHALRTEVLAARDALYAELQQFKKDADADLAACLQLELAGATNNYQDLKAAAGALDFGDLLAKARELIRTNDAVRTHLQHKFRHIFVDEFQDTDPIQADIVLLLAGGTPGKLFIVGDPKQAIYRFRGTDVATYWRVRDELQAQGGRTLQLTTSYRSVPSIQRFVNAAFERHMVENRATLQSGYVPLGKSRDEEPSQPSVIALPVPRPYGRRSFGGLKASAKAIEESLPDAVAALIAWLTQEDRGWTVAERDADGRERRVRLEPRHIAVLFRRFTSFGEDITRPYVDAIEARGIPHLLVGGKAFHGREEVEAIRAALSAIEWPDDELSVFAALKGPLFAIDDEHLFEFRSRYGTFHPFRIPLELGGNSGGELALAGEPTSHLVPIAGALRLLQLLHRGRNYRPVADTISRLLADTRAHVGFILRQGGEQALANVLHVAELARQYEAGGGISFRGFIDELQHAAQAEAAEAPILEEGSDGVRLMTVHKAKGLEFPVVILADMTCRMSRSDASRYLDPERNLCAIRLGGWSPHELHDHEAEEVARDEAEGIRLAYVAATRARDLLVVPAVGDEPWDGGWLSPLNGALYPDPANRRTAARAPKSPAFKSKDTVLQRPNDETATPMTVCPGLHEFPGGYSVVWWDPASLGPLDLKPQMGVRRDDLIVKDVARNVVADGRTKYDTWKLARITARERGSIPAMKVQTVREFATHIAAEAQRPQRTSFPVEKISAISVPLRLSEERPSGPAFGSLVHNVLARAPFDATREGLENIAGVEARLLALDAADATAAAAVVERVLGHELLQRARRAFDRGACRRETPVTLTLDDGTLVEGVVDMAFEENGEWTVVDYKTDREIAEKGEEEYRRQLGIYAVAIAKATGAPASAVLVRI